MTTEIQNPETKKCSQCGAEGPVTTAATEVRARYALLVDLCDKCLAELEAKQPLGWEGKTFTQLMQEVRERLGDMVDEYFSIQRHGGSYMDEPAGNLRFRWVSCYAVTGGSEGHYVHVDLVTDGYGAKGEAECRHLASVKTFQGMEHAQKIAARCAQLLGA